VLSCCGDDRRRSVAASGSRARTQVAGLSRLR
jgi:hypothetical protein